MHTYRDDYRRKLPHIQPLNGTFFVTYRLHGALPVNVRRELLEAFEVAKHKLTLEKRATPNALDELHRRYFARFDAVLDKTMYGPFWLQQDEVAEIVAKTLGYWDNKRIELLAFCIMANHVHAVFTLLDILTDSGQPNALDRFMHSVKGYSAGRANRLLQREGSFWEEETYDRLVRDDAELVRIIQYILNNPVKAGLCEHWRDWKWNYVKPEYDMF
jgi:putative transposase